MAQLQDRIPLALALVLSTVAMGADWDNKTVPITIEVTKDVQIRIEKSVNEPSPFGRAVLYSNKEALIPAGKRFKVVSLSGEGMCTIEFQDAQYFLHGCPWMRGFRDPKSDIFKIVEIGNGRP